MFVHPGCTNSGLRRTQGTFPKAFACPRVPGACQLFAIARILHHRLCSLFIRYMSSSFFIRSDRKAESRASPEFHAAVADILEQSDWYQVQSGGHWAMYPAANGNPSQQRFDRQANERQRNELSVPRRVAAGEVGQFGFLVHSQVKPE